MVIAWLAPWSLSALADAAQVRLAAEPGALSVGQTGTVRLIIVSGARGEPVFEARRAPDLLVGEGLREQFLGQSRQFQNINGRITQILEFDYRVTALEVGDWEIGPVELKLDDGSVITASPVTLAVSERQVIEGVIPDFEADASFITRGNEGKVYEGEVVLLHAHYRSRFVGSQVSWSLPEFDGLHLPGHGRPDESSYSIDDPSGTIVVHDLYVPLVAVATGKRDQGVALASIQIPRGGPDLFGFRRMDHEQLASKRLDLDVRPLPPPPPGFSGLIGEFEVRSELGANKAAVGQSIPWSIAVIGSGNLDGFTLSEMKADNASFYDNGSEITARIRDGAYHATASFRRVIVPTRPGELQLPELPLITFSPQRGEYVTIPISAGRIEVVEGKEGDEHLESYGISATNPDEPVQIDIKDIYTSGRLAAPRASPILTALFVCSVLPGLSIYSWLGLSRARERARAFLERRRKERSGLALVQAALRDLPADPTERLVALDRILRDTERFITTEQANEELRALRMRMGRVRFGDNAPDPTLAEDIRAFIEAAKPPDEDTVEEQ